MSFDQWLQILIALVPVITLILGHFLKLSNDTREEVAHALDYVLRAIQEGRMDNQAAKDQLLATGKLSESRVDKLLQNVEISMAKKTDYSNSVIPGVGLEFENGKFRVYPAGLVAKTGHKLSKWFKKKF